MNFIARLMPREGRFFSLFESHAALIVEEMERVERRIAALLQYARKEEFRPEPVDLAELAQNAARAFTGRFDEAGVAFECDARSPVTASVDRERIRQVLINLIENALDALAPQDSRRLSLRVSGNNGTAEIRITDNGPGVAPEALGRLFEPFFSLKPKGTGLGLANPDWIVPQNPQREAVASATPGVRYRETQIQRDTLIGRYADSETGSRGRPEAGASGAAAIRSGSPRGQPV